jgi:6-phosphofructokinase 1
MDIETLGEPQFASPVTRWVSDRLRVPEHIVSEEGRAPGPGAFFELAGPREKIFFNPAKVCAGIVTCGGLCPGLNNVIRSLYLQLHHCYGVQRVLGFQDGYRGLDPQQGREPIVLSSDLVDDIHREGGTILGTSRGPVDTKVAVDNLVAHGVNMLFTIGGDGTQRGGYELYTEARQRRHPIAVVGVPKTIDNDVMYVDRTFGFMTAIEQSAHVLECAHMEAHSVQNGISIVKLMGREAGFIAAGATVASQDVNFALIPEVPFKMEGENGFLSALKRRVLKRAHAVIVVAEGAGQDLLQNCGTGRDASGNKKLADIGYWLKEQISSFFKAEGIPCVVRYFDPSYIIRSVKADSEDAVLCDLFARNAVHAAMAGKTGLVIGLLHDHFIHVPVEKLVKGKKRLRPDSGMWNAVLATTGQPEQFA